MGRVIYCFHFTLVSTLGIGVQGDISGKAHDLAENIIKCKLHR